MDLPSKSEVPDLVSMFKDLSIGESAKIERLSQLNADFDNLKLSEYSEEEGGGRGRPGSELQLGCSRV